MKDEPNPLLVVDIPASPELNPVQNVLALCGMNPVAGRQIFFDLEGLDTLMRSLIYWMIRWCDTGRARKGVLGRDGQEDTLEYTVALEQ